MYIIFFGVRGVGGDVVGRGIGVGGLPAIQNRTVGYLRIFPVSLCVDPLPDMPFCCLFVQTNLDILWCLYFSTYSIFHVDDFNTRNKGLTAKFLKQGYRCLNFVRPYKILSAVF